MGLLADLELLGINMGEEEVALNEAIGERSMSEELTLSLSELEFSGARNMKMFIEMEKEERAKTKKFNEIQNKTILGERLTEEEKEFWREYMDECNRALEEAEEEIGFMNGENSAQGDDNEEHNL